MRLPALDAVRTCDLHALLHRPLWELLRQSLHREGQSLNPRWTPDSTIDANIIDVCLQGKQVYAEKRLERLKAKEKLMNMQLSADATLSNGAAIANGHANGYTNGVTKRKTQ